MKLGRLVFLVAVLAAGASCSEAPSLEELGARDAGPGRTGGGSPTGWVEVPGPTGVTGEAIAEAWPAGNGDILFAASGYRNGPDGTRPWGSRILRWTPAGGWREELVIAPATSAARSLSGSGPNDVWTAGNGHIYHRDAQGWQMVDDAEWRPQVADAQPLSFIGVAARAPGDVWFATPTSLLHRTASGWSAHVIHAAPEPSDGAAAPTWFTRLWLGQGTDVWVSGGNDTQSGTADPAVNPAFVARYADGGLRMESPASFWVSPVAATWPTSDGGFWFAEPGYWRLVNGDQYVLTPLCHYGGGLTVDGITQMVGDAELRVASIWGRGDDDVWAAGGYGDQPTPALFHYDGRTWRQDADAPAAGRFVLVTGDPQSTWLVTEGPRFFRQIRR